MDFCSKRCFLDFEGRPSPDQWLTNSYECVKDWSSYNKNGFNTKHQNFVEKNDLLNK